MPTDVYRGTTGVTVPQEISQEIWANLAETSAVMSAAKQIHLPGSGVTIPVITGDAEAAWAAETSEKTVSTPSLSSKLMTGYTLAVIVPFSKQFLRDMSSLYSEIVRRLPSALASKFDATVAGKGTAPGSNFDTLATATAQVVDSTDTFGDLSAVINAVAADGGDVSHWIANPALHGRFLTTVDGNSRQVFAPSTNAAVGQVGSVFGAPVIKTRGDLGTNVTGLAGDFAGSAVWGSVEGVQISLSDQATLTDGANTINLWQTNMVAVRAEIEVGFRVKDVKHFKRITSA